MSTGDYLDAATRRRVLRDLEQLQDEFRGIFGPETIERYVAESAASLADARVQSLSRSSCTASPANVSAPSPTSKELS